MCAPVIYFFLKQLKAIFPMIMLLLYVTQLWTSVPGFSIHAFMFFTIGAYMALYRHKFVLFLSNSTNILITICMIVFAVLSTMLYPSSFEELRFIQQACYSLSCTYDDLACEHSQLTLYALHSKDNHRQYVLRICSSCMRYHYCSHECGFGAGKTYHKLK